MHLSCELLRKLQRAHYTQVVNFLSEHGWDETTRRLLDDLHIVQFESQAFPSITLTVEYGEGYDTSIICRTNDERVFVSLVSEMNLSGMERRYKHRGGGVQREGYIDADGDVVLMGKPERRADGKHYTLIVTTTSNVDALWSESDYFG